MMSLRNIDPAAVRRIAHIVKAVIDLPGELFTEARRVENLPQVDEEEERYRKGLAEGYRQSARRLRGILESE